MACLDLTPAFRAGNQAIVESCLAICVRRLDIVATCSEEKYAEDGE